MGVPSLEKLLPPTDGAGPGTPSSARQPKPFMMVWEVQAEVIFAVH